jgi:hypothetical protein
MGAAQEAAFPARMTFCLAFSRKICLPHRQAERGMMSLTSRRRLTSALAEGCGTCCRPEQLKRPVR